MPVVEVGRTSGLPGRVSGLIVSGPQVAFRRVWVAAAGRVCHRRIQSKTGCGICLNKRVSEPLGACCAG